MAFEAINFRDLYSAAPTLAFLRDDTIGSLVNGQWDGDAETSENVFVQSPTYVTAVSRPARKANWGNPAEPSAKRLTLAMDINLRHESALYVEDEIVNAVRTYRANGEQVAVRSMALEREDEVLSYWGGLTAGGDHSTDDNGFAGQITEIDYAGDGTTGFDHDSGMPAGNESQKAIARAWLPEFLARSMVQLRRAAAVHGLTVGELNYSYGI